MLIRFAAERNADGAPIAIGATEVALPSGGVAEGPVQAEIRLQGNVELSLDLAERLLRAVEAPMPRGG